MDAAESQMTAAIALAQEVAAVDKAAVRVAEGRPMQVVGDLPRLPFELVPMAVEQWCVLQTGADPILIGGFRLTQRHTGNNVAIPAVFAAAFASYKNELPS